MAIDNPDVVDFIAMDEESGRVVLTISDHLEWGQLEKHLTLLERKIDAYVRFVSSGQLLESNPKAKNRPVEIQVVFKHAPSRLASQRLDEIGAAVEGAGFFFSRGVLPESG